MGDFVYTTTCSATCGTGIGTGYYVITTAAAYGGTECPYAVSAEKTQSCNTEPCRMLVLVRVNVLVCDVSFFFLALASGWLLGCDVAFSPPPLSLYPPVCVFLFSSF